MESPTQEAGGHTFDKGVTVASIVIELDRLIRCASDGQPDRGNFGMDPLEA